MKAGPSGPAFILSPGYRRPGKAGILFARRTGNSICRISLMRLARLFVEGPVAVTNWNLRFVARGDDSVVASLDNFLEQLSIVVIDID